LGVEWLFEEADEDLDGVPKAKMLINEVALIDAYNEHQHMK
jgi:hypothetical protein